MEEEQLILLGESQNPVRIKSFINSPIPSICYVIYDQEFKECIIVDPGNRDIIELIQFINEQELSPLYIFLTHEHFDHIGGVNSIRELYSCKLVSSEECSFNIIDPKRNFSLFVDQSGFSCKPAEILIKGRVGLKLWNNIEIIFIPTPGHSDGSICISIQNILITGDTLLNNVKTVIKLPGGSKSKLIESLRIIQDEFNDSTIILPGHGAPFFLSTVDFSKVL
jgi:hydroxyacylglutathione hydrolase